MRSKATIMLDDVHVKWVSAMASTLQVSANEVINRCLAQVSLDGLRNRRTTGTQRSKRRAHSKQFGY